MTQSEYARHRGCSPAAVHKAIDEKRITLTDNGKIDPVAADQQWEQNTRSRAGAGKQAGADSGAAAPEADSYMIMRSRREAAEAEMAEMKRDEMEGKMLVKAEVEAVMYEVARALRDGLTNCSRRIAADVATMDDPIACEDVINREHRALLENMTHRLGNKLGLHERMEAAE